MKSLIAATSLVALLAAAPALAQTASHKPSSADKSFIDHAARGGQGEVAIGQLAEQKASSPEAKALAQRLVTDHGQANQQLEQLAQQAGVKVPQGMTKEQMQTRAKLEKLSGPAFDRAFAQAEVQDHKKDIQYFQHEAATLKDPQLKSFAQQNLPVLKEHLQLAQQAEKPGMKSSGSSTPSGSATKSQ